MISANEARAITDTVKFEKSGISSLIDSTIRGNAKRGKDTASILFSAELSRQAADFLEKHGFRVVAETTSDGVLISASW